MSKLYEELKRRNVFRVGATYMVLAWLLMQFASIVLPTFDAPRWLLQAFLFFLILGFPLALVLAWAFELTPDGIRTAATAEPSATFTAATSQRLNYLILTLVVLAVGFLMVDRYVSGAVIVVRNVPVTSAPPAGTQRLSITLPDNQPVFVSGAPSRSLALSPDGRQVVYLGANIDGLPDQYGNQRHLLLRQLDSRTVRELPGTRGATQPFFSPDGQWVAFFTHMGDLKKVALAGGNPITLAQQISTSSWAFGVWTENNTLIFSEQNSVLQQVADEGGRVTPLTVLDRAQQETAHSYPASIPGVSTILFTVTTNGMYGEHRIESLLPATGERRVVLDNAYAPQVLSTGHLLFHREGALMLAPFDLQQLSVSGSAVPMTEDLMFDGNSAERRLAELAISLNGSLAYVPARERRQELGLVGRDGRFEGLGLPLRYMGRPRLAPDGYTLGFRVGRDQESGSEVHTFDMSRGTSNRLTFSDESVLSFAFHPDGSSLALERPNGGLWLQGPDRTRQTLVEQPATGFVRNADWSPDGKFLAYTLQSGPRRDIRLATPGEPPIDVPLLDSSAEEHSPAFSPDGRWLAYVSDQSGRSEIYLSRFPQGERLQVSATGGVSPVWHPDGSELYFVGSNNGVSTMMAVKLNPAGDSLQLASPEALFEMQFRDTLGRAVSYAAGNLGGPDYDVLPDGSFVLLKGFNTLNNREIVLVQNWFDEVRRLAPVPVALQ